MKRSRKILLLLVVVALIATGYGFYLFRKKPADVRKENAQYELTVTGLLEEYNKDETAANQKYLDKVIVVKGKVAEIKTEQDGQTTVVLEGGDPLASVICSFYEDEINTVKKLNKGELVLIKGKCTGKLMDVVLNRCSIQH